MNSKNVFTVSLVAALSALISYCAVSFFVRRKRLCKNRGELEFLSDKFVVVVGLGGVGSWCALELARRGVRKMRLVDFDRLTLSSLNRHAVGTRNDVGLSKCEALARHLQQINSDIELDLRVQLFAEDVAEQLLGDVDIDFVVDCIDNVATKCDLLEFCYERNLRVISAMGSGARLDPTKIVVLDLSETSRERLTRAMRKKLKERSGITTGITVVSSEELQHTKLLDLDDSIEEEEAGDFSVLPKFRTRIMPVYAPLPAMVGITAAEYVIEALRCNSTEAAMYQFLPHHFGTNELSNIAQSLMVREQNVFKNSKARSWPVRHVSFVVQSIWGSRSAISRQCLSAMQLCRWNPNKECRMDNVILASSEEISMHLKMFPANKLAPESFDPLDHYDERTVQYIEQSLKSATKFIASDGFGS